MFLGIVYELTDMYEESLSCCRMYILQEFYIHYCRYSKFLCVKHFASMRLNISARQYTMLYYWNTDKRNKLLITSQTSTRFEMFGPSQVLSLTKGFFILHPISFLRCNAICWLQIQLNFPGCYFSHSIASCCYTFMNKATILVISMCS